jgi:acyl-coenzyme A synthetase/AMP-(fatty) acid ligase
MDEIEHCCCIYDNVRNKIILFVMGAAVQEDIVAYLKNNLPYYMVPSKIIQMSKLPMTANGKIDRKKLQESI